MRRISGAMGATLLSGFLGLFLSASAGAASYEAELSTAMLTGPDLCSYAPCRDVLPGAERFSERKGRPSYVEAYGGEGDALIGYVFLSTDIVDIPAYSGKPIVTLIGMDAAGKITGAKILKHSEPILLVGIPESELTKFVLQFVGKNAWDKVEVGKARAEGGYLGVDAISGATVTVIAQNQVMMRSAYKVARQVGIVQAEVRPPAVYTEGHARRTWSELQKEGSIQRLSVSAADVGETDTREPLIEMYFGYLNAPNIGRSVLGDAAWERLMARLGPNDHAIFIVANGRTSFKGSGFVRGGIYDRVQVAQDVESVTFRDLDYLNLYSVVAEGAPSYTESAIFIVRSETFSAAYPWNLVFLANKLDKKTGQRTFANFDREYWVPAAYLEGGRPKITRAEPVWVRVWKSRAVEIVLFSLLLIGVAVVYANRDRLTRASNRHNKWPVNMFKYVAWAVSVGFVGFYLMAQPSITQVLTWFHSLLYRWTWELFLSDPFIFLFWIFIFVTVFLWGRGLFCGWLCPFGSLTEILYKIGSVTGLKRFQFHLPKPWHDRLKWVKYAAFFVLLGVSFFSMTLAEQMAEIEPFKTMFLVGIMNRAWPYTLFAAGLLALSIFMERPFCKYLCPLGASLAIPSTFRWFGLKRKQECNTCTACAVGCGSLAIDRDGRIDQRECLLCLDCMVLYTDDHACPPLAQERKSREKRGLPLTAIAADGYFIPVVQIDEPAPAAGKRPMAMRSDVDPRMPTDPVEPEYKEYTSTWRFLLAELRDHLVPWTVEGFRRNPVVQVGLALLMAAAVVVAVLATMEVLVPISVLAAWLLWSGSEVLARMSCLPYIKEGPWWQRHYRKSTWMDMLSYVGFKNLLAGAVLFIILKSAGLLILV
ncbi:MAG: 4Fe-4S binding protein [Gammaproteobacteria bacterium]